jgi:hypothetical protein
MAFGVQTRFLVPLARCSRLTGVAPIGDGMDKAASIASTRIEVPQIGASSCPHVLLPFGLVVAAFIVDLRTPSGLPDGLLYVFAILACQRVPKRNASLYAACGVMPPMVLGFVISPLASPMWTAVTNRLAAVVVIWVIALVLWRSAQTATRRESALAEIKTRMHVAEQLADDARTRMSDWLREEISVELQIIDWRLTRFSRCPRRGFDVQTEALVLRRAVQRARHSVEGKELGLRPALTPVASRAQAQGRSGVAMERERKINR